MDEIDAASLEGRATHPEVPAVMGATHDCSHGTALPPSARLNGNLKGASWISSRFAIDFSGTPAF
jgi:hypothetical protein